MKYYIHNAKFDGRMLSKEGIELTGEVHCTQAQERVIKNDYGPKDYSLDACVKRRGWEKDSTVDSYIMKNKLYTKVKIPGKKKEFVEKHYDDVPFELMSKYGLKDGWLHLNLGLDQDKKIKLLEDNRPPGSPSWMPVYNNEKKLTKVLMNMERKGLLCDRNFVLKAHDHEEKMIKDAQMEFQYLTAKPWSDSRLLLISAFDDMGIPYPKTPKGNPKLDADTLENMRNPIANVVNKIRYHEKRLSTYYSSFLYFMTEDNLIHASANQAGTTSGRMSYSNPNLQNVPKEDDPEDQSLPYHIRESFIPRPDHFYWCIDYEQMEYRLMLDYAGEMELIKQVMAGADIHQATADMVGITRKQAKTLNFAILYGAGIEKIAWMLGITPREASQLRQMYFRRLRKVESFIERVIKKARTHRVVFNWAGRRNHFSNRNLCYKAPNHLIQGGCADIVKFAMVALDEDLKGSTHDMLLQVHDELLFEAPIGDNSKIGKIVEIMENVYTPRNGLSMKVSVEHAFKNWGYRSKIKGMP